ncbi:MAG: 16S rRNA (uracil(1498)-N(3))-methyltransferase [Acidimicrobiia bacterium]|nr:16S rRNA (uracil(1498)-N(3))-methyltransferase [Acidimicrobiia bacterium]
MARRRFFVDRIHHQQAELTGEDAHHLTRVLRVEKNQRYELSDNHSVYLGEVMEARKDRVLFQILEQLPLNPLPVRLTLVTALVKFDRLEWILEKGTELGVEQFVLFQAERSEKGLDRGAEKRLHRWKRILLEASQQCRRDRLPELALAPSFQAAAGNAVHPRYVLDESGGPPLLSALPDHPEPGGTAALMIGPEGGWTDREREVCAAGGWAPVSQGPNILRAETAAISAVAILGAAWLAAQRTSNVSVAQ